MLKIEPIRTSPYHPQTDGLVERFNSTLKSMLKKIAKDDPTEWDSWLPYLLFAYREVPNESTGFSPFELLFGRHVRGPLDILKESWEAESESSESVVSYVLKMRERISQTMEVAKLSEKQKEEMELLLEEFNDVLQDKPGRTDMAEHSIETGTETPVRQLPYRIPYAQREEMMKEVQRMEEMGVVSKKNVVVNIQKLVFAFDHIFNKNF